MSRVVLLVEDNPTDEKLTLRAFSKCGVANEMVVARDGAEALDYLYGTGSYAGRDVSIQPAIVLLDLNLPRLSGLDVLRRLRADKRTALLPVVVLTASKQDEDIVRSYELGANAYVRKPVEFTEFVEAARLLGLFWLLLSEGPPTHRGPA